MRPFAIAIGVLASIATILTYLHLDPPWVNKYLPHIALPQGDAPPHKPTEPPFDKQYADGYEQARHRDFSMAVEYYKKAVTASGASQEQLAKAYDAMGYAYFRMGDYDNADSAFTSALQFDANSVSARVNRIKVMCGRGRDVASVAAALDGLRTSVSGNDYATRVVEDDKELFRRCAYTGVTPL